MITNIKHTIDELTNYHQAIQLGVAHYQEHLEKGSTQHKLAKHLNEQEMKILRESISQLERTIKVLQHTAFAESISYDFGNESDVENFRNLYRALNPEGADENEQ